MRPRESYKDRIYSTNVVGWEGVKHIGKNEKGEKISSEIIKQALELGGFREDQEKKEILVGFGHAAALSQADKIVEAVKGGQIRHFFLIGGCDARTGKKLLHGICSDGAERLCDLNTRLWKIPV